MTTTLLSLAFTAAALATPTSDDVKLPIEEITLYRSGVGAFELAAPITGDATVRIRFPTDDINDILKSMTILDLGNGTVGPVSYGSKEPLERRLASFGVDISQAPSIDRLFRQLRGAKLKVATMDGPKTGTILGVEERRVVESAGRGGAVVTRPHLNLLTETGVRSIDIAAIASFELVEEELAEELRLALTALAEQRAERMKTVELSFRAPATESRTVVVSYVREMPVWKTSYRLVLPKGTNKPTLQGWAIVENTTDDEWKDVRLSLASGRPVGFTMDLYEPIFAYRPDVPVPLDEGLAPKLYESGGRAAPSEDRRAMDKLARLEAPGAPVASGSAAFLTGSGRRDQAWSADGVVVEADGLGDAQASGGEVGGQFHYTVDTPVTLARQRSAMLPILLAEIDGRRLSILTVEETSRAPQHPMQGVELENDTGLHLMPGPIAVYDAGSYAGDAQIDHTARNQRRLLSFAMDIDVECKTRASQVQTLVSVKIVDGGLVRRTRSTRERTYEFVNYDEKRGRTVLVEYPKDASWRLAAPPAPNEETSTLYRFEVDLPAGGTATHTVVEDRVDDARYAVTSLTTETLLELRTNGKLSAEVFAAVQRAAGLQAEVKRQDDAMGRLDAERQTITQEQSRIRKNMARLQSSSALHRRYLEKLGTQEDRLEQIAEEREAAQTVRDAAQEQLQNFLRELTID